MCVCVYVYVGIKRDEHRTTDGVRAAPARTPFSSAPYLLRSDEIAKCVGILGFLSALRVSPRVAPPTEPPWFTYCLGARFATKAKYVKFYITKHAAPPFWISPTKKNEQSMRMTFNAKKKLNSVAYFSPFSLAENKTRI